MLSTSAPPSPSAATRYPLESTYTTVNGLRHHARVAVDQVPADAPAVVLVHGLGVSGTYLVPTAERLAADYRVYVPDLPGFGKTEKPDHILNVPELADALAAWVKAAGPVRATYLGNSLGCQTIIELALRHPELIDHAVLVGPTMDPAARSTIRQCWRGLIDLFREPLSYWPLLTHDYLVAGTIRTIRTLQLAVADPVVPKLPQVKIPTLVVRGSRDPIAPESWVEEMYKLLPQGQLVILPGVAHVANYTAPDQLAGVVRAFLNQA